MTSRVRRFTATIALLTTAALVLAACGDDDDEGGTTGPKTTAGEGGGYEGLSGTINGSGASFPDAFYQVAIEEFSSVAPDLRVNYNAVGSGQGKKDFAEGLNNFAGTDSLVKPEEGIDAASFVYVPTVAAPITVSYNLPGVDKLQLSGETIAKIFQREITTWADPAVAKDNPGARLPKEDITVAHRADGSGTTANFTKYLTKAAPDTWKLGAGDTVAWPADTQAGQKNTGVAQIVKDTEGAVGYVDLADARATGLKFAAIKNKAGKYVEPTLEATSAALEGATVNDDNSYDPIDAEGAEAYPIAAPTYILVRSTYDDADVGAAVKGFVKYLLTDGQDLAESVDFAPLPAELKEKAMGQLDKVQP